VYKRQPLFTDGLKAGLNGVEGIESIGHALNGKTCLEFLRNHEVDVAILDIELPDINGLELVSKIKDEHADLKIVILTMHDSSEFIEKMISLDVDAYLLKNSPVSEIIDAITTVSKNQRHIQGTVLNTVMKFINRSEGEQDPLAILTGREKEIIDMIHRGKTNTEIANDLFISVHTASSHRKNILQKLNLKNTVDLIHFVYKNNLLK